MQLVFTLPAGTGNDVWKSPIDRRAYPGLPSDTLMQGAKTNPSLHGRCRTMLVLLLAQMLALTAFANPQKPGMPRAQKHESRHEIDQLEEAWRVAVLKGNVAALDALLADDYMAITPTGTLQTKEQTLDSVRSGRVRFATLEFSDRKVRFYGTTALVTSRADVTATTPEGHLSGSYRYVRVYVRDGRGMWKVVSFEANRIRDPDERK